MDQTDIKMLMLMEVIERDGNFSQREIARELNISLGLVNSIIKNLSAKGMIKTIKNSKKKVQYVLTRQGVVEKDNYIAEFICYGVDLYKDTKKRVEKLLRLLQNEGKHRFVLFGSGELCEIACILLERMDNGTLRIVDDEKAGSKICGIPIQREMDIRIGEWDAAIITNMNDTDNIRKRLIERGFADHKIHTIFSRSKGNHDGIGL